MLSMGFARGAPRDPRHAARRAPGPALLRHLPPDIERLAHAQLRRPRVHHAVERPGRGARDRALRLRDARGDKLGSSCASSRSRTPRAPSSSATRATRPQRVAEALKRAASTPTGSTATCRRTTASGSWRRRARGGCASSSRPTSRRAASTSRTSRTSSTTTSRRPRSSTCTARAARAAPGARARPSRSSGPKDIGNLYLLRLTYKIRPDRAAAPERGRAQDARRDGPPPALRRGVRRAASTRTTCSLARRLLTHEEAERILAGLLRDHLGARGGDAVAEAGEARRARNPPPEPVQRSAPSEERAPQRVEGLAPAGPPRREPRPRERERDRDRDRDCEQPREPRGRAASRRPGERAPAAGAARRSRRSRAGSRRASPTTTGPFSTRPTARAFVAPAGRHHL